MKTVQDLSEAWGVSEVSIRHLCRRGRIPEAEFQIVNRKAIWTFPDGVQRPMKMRSRDVNTGAERELKARLAKIGVTQKEMANRLGIKPSTLRMRLSKGMSALERKEFLAELQKMEER